MFDSLVATDAQVDHQYYQVARPGTTAARVMQRARNAIYRDFERVCPTTEAHTVLDVGVSDVIQGGDNILERRYPWPSRLTAAGLGAGTAFRQQFPKIKYVQIVANARLPFEDKAFSIATANAVLEHVGSPEAQRHFISELMRVADRVFVTVPNRFFPVEHHTGIPFLAWHDQTFAFGCRLFGKDEWSDTANLIPMSRTRLRRLLPQPATWRIDFTGLRLGPISSNIFAMFPGSTHCRAN